MRSTRARVFRAGPAPIRSAALLLLALAAVLTCLPAVAATPLASAPWCRAAGPLRAAELPRVVRPTDCPLDGRVVEDHGVLLRVPARGEKVGSEAMSTSGSTQVLELARRPDGTLLVVDSGDEAAEAGSAGGAGTTGGHPCHDSAYALSDYRDTDGRTWHYKASTTPPGLSIGAVAQDLVDAFNAVSGSRNDCGMGDEVDAVQRYGGNTPRGSGINHEGLCPAQGDGHSVVDFGNLPDQTLARTCWRGTRTAHGWYEITEADVKLRKTAPLFTGPVPAGCKGARYSIQAIVTHEAGHSFGLRHVPESDHPELTMSERTPACSLDPLTLGLGDIKALRSVY